MPNGQPGGDRIYYDACALENGDAYRTLVNHSNLSHTPVVSDLAFGEALTAVIRKDDDAKVDALIVAVKALKPVVELAYASEAKDALPTVQDILPRLRLADAVHLAIALKRRCVVLRTTDRDLLGIPSEKIKALQEAFALPSFRVQPPPAR